MALPTYVASGSPDNQSMPTDLTPSYPAGLAADDLLVLRVHHRNNLAAASNTFSVPGSFAIEFTDQIANCRQLLYFATATGSESGTITVGTSGSGTVRYGAIIHAFRGIDLADIYEAANVEGAGASTILNDVGITTTGADRLAVNFATHDGSPVNSLTVFTGQTGGTWVLKSTDSSQLPASCVQTADMASSGTINGGGLTGLNAGVWINRGLAFKPTSGVSYAGRPHLRGAGVPGMAQHGMRGIW